MLNRVNWVPTQQIGYAVAQKDDLSSSSFSKLLVKLRFRY